MKFRFYLQHERPSRKKCFDITSSTVPGRKNNRRVLQIFRERKGLPLRGTHRIDLTFQKAVVGF